MTHFSGSQDGGVEPPSVKRMAPDILETKIHIPAPPHHYVPRRQLLQQMDAGLGSGHRLLLVSAPAGFGKTTLLSAWISHSTYQSAWLTLERRENDPAAFLAYLVAALQRLDPALGEDILVMLGAPQPPTLETALTTLINQLASLGGPTVIALDDYHQITNPAIHNAIDFFLEHLPVRAHLVIGSRADPPLPLARLRARGQMTELRTANLRFSSAETGLFLNGVMQLGLSADQIDVLEARTEGWAAGLQMAALSLRGREDTDSFIRSFSGSHRFIIDFLSEEVLGSLPEQLQTFLLDTSVLRRLCGPLCEAVTRQKGSQETLETLETSNLFLMPLDDRRTWYRYHNLFADVMESRLRRLHPDKVGGLHRRAAAWLREHDLPGEALEHALAANDPKLAAGIVEDQALAQLRAGSLSTLLGWLARLPPESILARPQLSIASAWAHLLTGQPDSVDEFLAAAEGAPARSGESPRLEGQIAAVRCYLETSRGDLETASRQAQLALELLSEEEITERSVVAYVVGGLHYLQGDFEAAAEAMQAASRLGRRAGNIHLAVSAMSSQAELEAGSGHLKEAGRILGEALQLGTGSNGQPLPIAASVFSGLARLKLAENDLPAAQEYAQTGLELGRQWLNPDSQVGCLLTLARVSHQDGRQSAALAYLEDARRLAEAHPLTPAGVDQIAAAAALITAAPGAVVDQHGLPETLTARELEVLALLADGLSNRAIAEELVIALGTAKTHISRIMGKLNAENRTQAVALARELGLVS
jgi:LuxR family maltose regulon positive regulatory protein